MKNTSHPWWILTGLLRNLGILTAGVLLVVVHVACAGVVDDPAEDQRVQALEASVQALADENNALRAELATLRDENATLRERLDDQDARLQELEVVTASMETFLPLLEQWTKGKENKEGKEPQPEGTVLERTVRLAEEAGGEVYRLEHPARKDPAILALPLEHSNGTTPLIVSLHGFGGNSADHSRYFPLHEHVNSHGFALLLPNGIPNNEGSRFWNPTDECCDGGKSGEDDVAYLTELVARAREIKDFGPVYIFGYSNGGFMAHHLACKGLRDLRAVVAVAGTSYVADSSCAGALPVSVLHIHGTADNVILFSGDASEPEGDDKGAFYLGAQDMAARYSQLAGCEWPAEPQPYANLDLDQAAPGAETQAFRLQEGCAEGITVELWMGVGSSHAPAYGDAFMDALLAWLLSQQ
ncbi:MAG: hypothetical protein F4X83_08410 [Chloroflexi bacterium]|nr:hypothetical protein [Chloroflexota bacterium]